MANHANARKLNNTALAADNIHATGSDITKLLEQKATFTSHKQHPQIDDESIFNSTIYQSPNLL